MDWDSLPGRQAGGRVGGDADNLAGGLADMQGHAGTCRQACRQGHAGAPARLQTMVLARNVF